MGNGNEWGLCCCFSGHTFCLLALTGLRMTFETPEQIVALFRKHAFIDKEWADLADRVSSVARKPFQLPAELSNEENWIPVYGPYRDPS
jgi:hypothetical protein